MTETSYIQSKPPAASAPPRPLSCRSGGYGQLAFMIPVRTVRDLLADNHFEWNSTKVLKAV